MNAGFERFKFLFAGFVGLIVGVVLGTTMCAASTTEISLTGTANSTYYSMGDFTFALNFFVGLLAIIVLPLVIAFAPKHVKRVLYGIVVSLVIWGVVFVLVFTFNLLVQLLEYVPMVVEKTVEVVAGVGASVLGVSLWWYAGGLLLLVVLYFVGWRFEGLVDGVYSKLDNKEV